MIRLRLAAAARCNTSNVAIIVVAIPVTGVSGEPALMVSTVSLRHGTPTLSLIRAITCAAVSGPEAARACQARPVAVMACAANCRRVVEGIGGNCIEFL